MKRDTLPEEAGPANRAAPLNRGEPSGRALPKLKAPIKPEKVVQRECVIFYRTIGCTVYSTSQARRSKVALGLPDLFVCWPDRKTIFVHEVKSATGKLSPDQEKFRQVWEASGGFYVVGGLVAASDMVAKIRNITADPWPTPVPKLSTDDVSRWLWDAGTYREGGYIAPARDVLREASGILRSD